ncbi:hypothetical protein KKD37_04645 [Patescibacteria group bacterium]|nr:hypothetical protein [Patescibacteria group bacterium]
MAYKTETESGGPISPEAEKIIERDKRRDARRPAGKVILLDEEVLVMGNNNVVTGVRGRRIRIKSC